MPKTKRSSKRADLLETLWAQMRYCPICGDKLFVFGGSTSELKRCNEYHGVMKIVGKTQGSKIGILLEVDEKD